VIGPVAHLSAGERAELCGEWQEHSRYGPQLRASAARPLDPIDREGQLAYLTSLRHIGPARAAQLLERQGEEVLEVIEADPFDAFKSVRGVSSRQASAAAESWHASRTVRDLHVQLAPHGLAHLAAPSTPATGPRRCGCCGRTPTA
jgi:exodeoxyribonuclease V alpha subunit